MDRELIRKYAGKKIKVNLNSGMFYTGVIDEMYGSSMTFIDKFNEAVAISYDSIILIKEVGE